MRNPSLSVTGMLAGLVFSGAAFAVDAPASGASAPQGTHRGPSSDAIAACSGKDEGAWVTFTDRKGNQVSATCKTGPSGTLAARPKRAGHVPHGASAPKQQP